MGLPACVRTKSSITDGSSNVTRLLSDLRSNMVQLAPVLLDTDRGLRLASMKDMTFGVEVIEPPEQKLKVTPEKLQREFAVLKAPLK